ncbi:MAG: hypothetical protein GY807_18980 [Gammaproteobacteria bacterium]|nr:hypothetical protein [Gammaproteobacteria bacterium]
MDIYNEKYVKSGQQAVRVFDAGKVPAVLQDMSEQEAASTHELKDGKVAVRNWHPTEEQKAALATGELITLDDMTARLKVSVSPDITEE